MFGSSNPFGQSSNSPFGSPSVFGQTSNANSNPFAAQPFGSTSPFGSQTGGSIFGGTSTGVFGTPAPSPVFGASSAPAFGASSSPAFGASSSSFGGSSVFGQTPAFGGFGSTTQSSPFGSSFQQSQPAFGSSAFGSSPFGQPAFGAPSPTTPTFGASSTPAFGAATSTPAFGSTSTPTFGNTGSAFGVSNTSVFGSGAPTFGASSTPAFGASSTPAFGAASTPAFGASSTPAFGASSTPAFGASSTPAFGASSTPAFGATTSPFSFGSSPAFGQSTSAFGSSPFGATTTAFGAQSSMFGGQTTAPAFGSPGFGQASFGSQRGGSRVTAYANTPEADSGSSTQPAGKLESISAMPAYKEKSHEEIRWEDYQLGDKGGPNPAGQSSAGMGFNMNTTQQSNPFTSPSPAFGQSSANPFSSSTSTNPFAPKTSTFGTPGFGSSTPSLGSSPFAAAASNPFGSASTPAPSVFGSTPAFGSTSSPSLFGTPSSSTFGTSTSIFGTTQAQGTTSSFATGLNFGSTQSSPLFQSTTPTFGQTSSPFGQAPSAFGQPAPSFGQSTPAFGQSNPFGGNLFSSTPSLLSTNSLGFNQTTPSLSTPFQSAQPTQSPGGFGFAALAGSTPSIFGQSNFGQPSANQSPPPQSITNPFGTLPAMPQMSIGGVGNAPSVQYGISSLPVVDKPSPIRLSSVLTSRHLSQRRIRLPARKYHPKNDGSKVSFFSDEEDTTSTPKADALFIPRENPRALVIRPVEQWPGKASAEKPKEKNVSSPVQADGQYTEFTSAAHQNDHSTDYGNRNQSENGAFKEQTTPVKTAQKTNGVHEDPKSDSYITLTGHRAGEAAIVYEHGADIEALMPKLRHSDYYTEPRIQELAAKERAEPGFCRRVKNFIVGRHNYGSIRFLGVTDVRCLDLESLIQFNHREVIVYMDETKKPPVGQGLNKAAEVTLLNVKCVDKKTGRQLTEGPRVEKYKEMLKKKAEDQGAEFVSYDPVKGEWKFRVSHFSRYGLEDALLE